MDNNKRRSSILKSQSSNANTVVTATLEECTRRRVSFSTVRTVKQYDEIRNAMMSPHDEPVRLCDTGSSDGLGSTHCVTTGMDSTVNAGFDHTADFFPTAASTPMLRNEICVHPEAGDDNMTMMGEFTANLFNPLPQSGDNGDELDEVPMDISGATLTTTDVKRAVDAEKENKSVNDTTIADSTKALFRQAEQSKANFTEVSAEINTKYLEVTMEPTAAILAARSEQEEEEGAVDDNQTEDIPQAAKGSESFNESKQVDERNLDESSLLGTNVGMSFMKESHAGISIIDESEDFTFHNLSNAEQFHKSAITPHGTPATSDHRKSNISDALPKQIAALHVSPAPTRLGLSRIAGSPLAVVKKKTRLDGPVKLFGQPGINESSRNITDRSYIVENVLNHSATTEQPIKTPAALRTSAATPVHTPEEVSKQLKQTRRRLRRSLDKPHPPLDTLRVSDIVVPDKPLYSMSFDLDAGSNQVRRDESFQSDGTQKMGSQMERSKIGDQSQLNSHTTEVIHLMDSFLKNFDALDFDMNLLKLDCFPSSENDCEIVTLLKKTILTALKSLVARDAQLCLDTYLDYLDEANTSSRGRTLSPSDLINLCHRSLSRKESRMLEKARSDAQVSVFLFRVAVFSEAKRKSEERLAKILVFCNEKRAKQKKIQEYEEMKNDDEMINKKLLDFEQLKSIVAEMGEGKDLFTLRSELRSIRRAKAQKHLENIPLGTEKCELQFEVWSKQYKKSKELTRMFLENERKMQVKRDERDRRIRGLLSEEKNDQD
ncbi:unnamed protein product [Anisakis simplex]|uniref:Kinetochore scaffold 1 n=1 Tax=Anisakis simplex TaxID=6269 RepID=A0A0M3K1F2_ANISI|nr:unnamed protein product [Anisakis simplex]